MGNLYDHPSTSVAGAPRGTTVAGHAESRQARRTTGAPKESGSPHVFPDHVWCLWGHGDPNMRIASGFVCYSCALCVYIYIILYIEY